MDVAKDTKWKKNLFFKAWYRSLVNVGSKKSSKNTNCKSLTKSRTWHCSTIRPGGDPQQDMTRRKNSKSQQVAPDGCFSVYVGPEKQRFVIKAEFANHPLFKMLLEDAELEYGYNSQGPILLPCDVGLFYKVLAEIESRDDDDENNTPTCSSLALCSTPTRRFNNKKSDGSYHGAYRILSPSRMLKLNKLQYA